MESRYCVGQDRQSAQEAHSQGGRLGRSGEGSVEAHPTGAVRETRRVGDRALLRAIVESQKKCDFECVKGENEVEIDNHYQNLKLKLIIIIKISSHHRRANVESRMV